MLWASPRRQKGAKAKAPSTRQLETERHKYFDEAALRVHLATAEAKGAEALEALNSELVEALQAAGPSAGPHS